MKSYNQALKILKKSHLKISSEVVKSVDSINRICSSNIYSKNNHPSENNSALDGFAINSNSTKGVSFKNIKIKPTLTIFILFNNSGKNL